MKNYKPFIVAYLALLLVCVVIDLVLMFSGDIQNDEPALKKMFIVFSFAWGSTMALLLLYWQVTHKTKLSAAVPHILFAIVVVLAYLVGYFTQWLGFLISPLFYGSLLIFTIVFATGVNAIRTSKPNQSSS